MGCDCSLPPSASLFLNLLSRSTFPPPRRPSSQATASAVSWTAPLCRMLTLVSRCVEAGEPVLLVGETGCGKTTVCQLLAMLRKQPLHILNCHQHTETADFLGGYRPARGAARAAGAPFVWEDGPLIQARLPALPEDTHSLNHGGARARGRVAAPGSDDYHET